MRKATTLLVTAFCMIAIQTTLAAGPETITAEDVKFTKFKLDVVPVDYSDSFPGLPKVGGGKRLKYPMVLLEYEWEIDSGAKKKHKDSAAENGLYYIDNMEFEWRVVLAQPTKGNSVRLSGKNYNITESKAYRMRKKVHYSNIPNDGSRYACIFIEPRMIERLFRGFKENYMFIELVVRIEGEEALRLNAHGEDFAFAHSSDGEKAESKLQPYMPKRRSTEPSFFLSEKVREVHGVLLAKNQTPWALSQLNVFETIVESDKK